MLKIFALAKNTFIETLRKPVYVIIINVALLMIALSPHLTMYTLEDDTKLLREIGLSTLVLASLFIAVFSASSAISEEIENKTITTVLSKPVRRPIFIISKFLGASCAVLLAHYICTIWLLMAIRFGVLERASDIPDFTVFIVGGAIIVLTISLTFFFNYIYDWRATSTSVILEAIFSTLGIIFLAFFDRNWQFNPSENGINSLDIHGAVLLFFAALVMVALATALSSRFNIIVTLSFCVGLFLLGLISDYVFGRIADQHLWAKIFYYIIPNLQVFWISDAIHEGSVVKLKYIYIICLYAFCYIGGILSLAIGLFQRRQVG